MVKVNGLDGREKYNHPYFPMKLYTWHGRNRNDNMTSMLDYYRQWFFTALTSAYTIASASAFILSWFIHIVTNRFKSKYPFLEKKLTIWLWRITTFIFALIFAANIFQVPYRINQKQQIEISNIKNENSNYKQRIGELEAKLKNSPSNAVKKESKTSDSEQLRKDTKMLISDIAKFRKSKEDIICRDLSEQAAIAKCNELSKEFLNIYGKRVLRILHLFHNSKIITDSEWGEGMYSAEYPQENTTQVIADMLEQFNNRIP